MNASTNYNHNNKLKISIGLPVYNGESFIRKRIESILKQSFSDFELIISDNASTDSTLVICEEYAEKDNRIRLIRQKENMGQIWNFNFVLQQAKYDYFVWAAVDDIWNQDFLKKNFKILTGSRNVVCSLGKVIPYNIESNNILTKSNSKQKHSISYVIKHLIEKILLPRRITSYDICSISGSYEKKVRIFLKNLPGMMIYGVCQTQVLRNSIITKVFLGSDFAIDLNILKHGDIHVIDENLMFYYTKGISSNVYTLAHQFNINRIKLIFIWMPLTLWCLKNLGFKIFFKNLDQFLLINYISITIHLLNFYARYIKQLGLRKKILKHVIPLEK